MICTKCNIDLPQENFSIRSDTNKPRRQCKSCRKAIRRNYYENNKDHDLARCKEYYLKNKSNYKDWAKKYYKDNKSDYRRRAANWRKNNINRSKELSKKNSQKFRKSDYGRFRSVIRSSARRYGDYFKISDLSYGVEKFLQRIEFNFKDGMNWGNYGEWEIDHIKPVKRFYDQGIMDINLVNALCNLKPMWKSDNRKKSSSFILDS